jgi:hypothetical protein
VSALKRGGGKERQTVKLSLVELATVAPGADKPQALNDALDAARQAEDLGYHRIWYAEHHDTAGFAAPAPEILIALAARATSRIRVGSGAVLLRAVLGRSAVGTVRPGWFR